MKIFHGKNKGFTLIELILVIAVLGILSAIAIPRISGMNDKAKDVNIAQVAGSIRTAMEVYYQENKNYPEETIMENWTDLKTTLSVLDLTEIEDYNIKSGSFEYNIEDDDYEIIVESNSTPRKFLIANNKFEEYNE